MGSGFFVVEFLRVGQVESLENLGLEEMRYWGFDFFKGKSSYFFYQVGFQSF